MSKRDDIRHLWKEAYRYSDEYLDMYFGRIYRDADAMTVEVDGKTVSVLLLQPYRMLFYGEEMPVSYIEGAVTRRNARGQGHMTALLRESLQLSRDRGDMLCALIPDHDWLYYFFDRSGFAAVFLADVQRFTALHPFAVEEPYKNVEDPYSDAVYEAFSRYEHERTGGMLHSRRDFLNTLDKLAMQPGGTFIAVGGGEEPVAAMAWASLSDGVVRVHEVLGTDSEWRTAAMNSLRRHFPDTPMRFPAPADTPGHRRLYPCGMARIVNAGLCLDTMARANPQWKCVLRVHDPILTENSRIYTVANGRCVESDHAKGHVDLDVDIDVLTRIIFSSESTGAILGFPSRRTRISLM